MVRAELAALEHGRRVAAGSQNRGAPREVAANADEWIPVDRRLDCTIVETAVGAVDVVCLDPAHREPVTVEGQHYAVIKEGREPTVTRGRLDWSLEPIAPL